MTRHAELFPDAAALAAVCRRHQVRRLAMFGSAQKGTDQAGSDVDLLVEFAPRTKPTLLEQFPIGSDHFGSIRSEKIALTING